MKTKSITLGLVIAVLFAACSGITTVTDQKPGTDFSQYQTYALENLTDPEEPQSVLNNPINISRFESEIADQLEEKGLNPSNDPDVIISYAIAQDERTSYRGTTTDMGGGFYGGRWGRGWYGAGPTMSTTQMDQVQIPTGTATVALKDAKTGELLWYTTASGDLKINSKKVGKGIPKAVEMLMEEFPIQEARATVEQPV
ncbi:MAG: DUF4136 domain-containing protein [Bacteroidota bacterium]